MGEAGRLRHDNLNDSCDPHPKGVRKNARISDGLGPPPQGVRGRKPAGHSAKMRNALTPYEPNESSDSAKIRNIFFLKSRSRDKVFLTMISEIDIPDSTKAANVAGPQFALILHDLSCIDRKEKAKKIKKWPGGQRNLLKRLVSDKEIQGNASFFL
jgi:hypothetical protein